MPKELTQQEQEEVQEQEQQGEKSKAEEAQDSQDKEEGDASGGGLWDGIPENHPVRQEVRNLRQEAAAKRTENKSLQDTISELEQQTAEMKSPDEFQKAVSEAQDKVRKANLATARERFGRTHNLPESLIPRLEGETDEEIEADALRLKEDLGIKVSTKRQGPPKSPPAGGLNPADEQVANEEIVQRLLKGQRNF